jgi:hypothetical protein
MARPTAQHHDSGHLASLGLFGIVFCVLLSLGTSLLQELPGSHGNDQAALPEIARNLLSSLLSGH